MKVRGHAAVFNSRSLNLGGFVEVIQPGAFADSLKTRDVLLLSNHDSGKPLARKSTGSLRLSEDDIGLRFEAELPDTPGGKDMSGIIAGRIVVAMSFGFFVARADDEEWQELENGLLLRTLRRVQLLEVSPVSFPAYEATTVSTAGGATGARSRPGRAEQTRRAGGLALVSKHPNDPIDPRALKRARLRMLNRIDRHLHPGKAIGLRIDYGLL